MENFDKLITAIRNKNITTVEALLKYSDTAKLSSDWGDTPLMKAAQTAEPEIFNMVLKNSTQNINAKTKAGMTALLFSITSEDKGIFYKLINSGAILDNDNITKHTIASHPDFLDKEVIETLISIGASLEILSDGIIKSNCEEYISKLIEERFKISSKLSKIGGGSSIDIFISSAPSDIEIYNSFCFNIMHSNYDKATQLIKYVKIFNGYKEKERTPLMSAAEGENRVTPELRKIAAHLEILPYDIFLFGGLPSTDIKLKIFKNLITSGADVNKPAEDNSTPIFYAAANSDIEYLKLLLDAGANPNIKSNAGFTPLLIAFLGFESLKYVKLLLEHGAHRNKDESENLLFEKIRDFQLNYTDNSLNEETEKSWNMLISC